MLMSIHPLIRISSAVALLLVAGAPAFSDGGGGSELGGTEKTSPQYAEYRQGLEELKRDNYAGAVELFEQAVDKDPESANAWNYLGYSRRNLRQFDEALIAYQKALELNPKHRGAHEYLGELYLQTDQLEKAKAQLERIDDLCFLSCKEYRKLKKAIKSYESG